MKLGKILILEDDPLWQAFLQDPLAAEYDLTIVANTEEAKVALDVAKDKGLPFNLVTVDIGLDEANKSFEGEDILAFVSQYHPTTKCIVVTGHQKVGTSKLRDYFKKFDVLDFIGKDEFDMVQFKEMVDKIFYFHQYRILAEVGRGGMGTVYKALDGAHDNRLVALKVLHRNLGLKPTEALRRLARFEQEVETIRKLNHPNIVIIYDYFIADQTEGQVFFVMEFLDGQTLDEVLSEEIHLSPAEVVRIGLQLCDGLAYAHDHQVVHRDIKPSNIIRMKNQQVKITDFGIAKALDSTSTLTRTEEIIGTLDYMPPEQIMDTKTVDQRADIYATGAVLYELLGGRRPYEDGLLKLYADPKPLQEINPTVPPEFVNIVMKAMARQTTDRYQTAAEMAQALQEIKS